MRSIGAMGMLHVTGCCCCCGDQSAVLSSLTLHRSIRCYPLSPWPLAHQLNNPAHRHNSSLLLFSAPSDQDQVLLNVSAWSLAHQLTIYRAYGYINIIYACVTSSSSEQHSKHGSDQTHIHITHACVIISSWPIESISKRSCFYLSFNNFLTPHFELNWIDELDNSPYVADVSYS